jgi:pyruvate dehydrogenase complex dehydrogenase (E1) component
VLASEKVRWDHDIGYSALVVSSTDRASDSSSVNQNWSDGEKQFIKNGQDNVLMFRCFSRPQNDDIVAYIVSSASLPDAESMNICHSARSIDKATYWEIREVFQIATSSTCGSVTRLHLLLTC